MTVSSWAPNLRSTLVAKECLWKKFGTILLIWTKSGNKHLHHHGYDALYAQRWLNIQNQFSNSSKSTTHELCWCNAFVHVPKRNRKAFDDRFLIGYGSDDTCRLLTKKTRKRQVERNFTWNG
jgi:hypothetical protein